MLNIVDVAFLIKLLQHGDRTIVYMDNGTKTPKDISVKFEEYSEISMKWYFEFIGGIALHTTIILNTPSFIIKMKCYEEMILRNKSVDINIEDVCSIFIYEISREITIIDHYQSESDMIYLTLLINS